MAKDMLITEELFVEILDVLKWYANAEWTWNGLDESVVSDWNFSFDRDQCNHHFKNGGNVARKMLEKLETRLLYT